MKVKMLAELLNRGLLDPEKCIYIGGTYPEPMGPIVAEGGDGKAGTGFYVVELSSRYEVVVQ